MPDLNVKHEKGEDDRVVTGAVGCFRGCLLGCMAVRLFGRTGDKRFAISVISYLSLLLYRCYCKIRIVNEKS